ncbi:MAG: carbohydrate ABC transporter permease [bacterium]|nr:carbohydrate ABC transporter permease [bacterium]
MSAEDIETQERILTKRSAILVIPVYVVLITWAFVSFVPVIWMFLTAFTQKDLLVKMPPEISLRGFTFDNFVRLYEYSQIPLVSTGSWLASWLPKFLVDMKVGIIVRWFLNSLFLACVNTGFNLFFDSLAGYSFAKRRFPGNKFLFWMILSTMMVPGQVTLVPLFLMMINLGLLDSYLALILPSIAGVFGIFLMKQYIQSLPSDLEEAGRIDGCSEFGIFWRIILPLCKPVLAVLGIFIFVGNWNNFLWPLIILKSEKMYTLQVGLAILQQLQEHGVDYGIRMAGAVVAAVPILIVFLFMQKYFIKGLTIGSVKG